MSTSIPQKSNRQMNACTNEHWLACCYPGHQPILNKAYELCKCALPLEYVADGSALRKRVQRLGAQRCSVLVGLTQDGVSDINLAAALVHDGCASVMLVGVGISGSVRSRAMAAGISDVWDMQAFGCIGFDGNANRATLAHSAPELRSKPVQTHEPAQASLRADDAALQYVNNAQTRCNGDSAESRLAQALASRKIDPDIAAILSDTSMSDVTDAPAARVPHTNISVVSATGADDADSGADLADVPAAPAAPAAVAAPAAPAPTTAPEQALYTPTMPSFAEQLQDVAKQLQRIGVDMAQATHGSSCGLSAQDSSAHNKAHLAQLARNDDIDDLDMDDMLQAMFDDQIAAPTSGDTADTPRTAGTSRSAAAPAADKAAAAPNTSLPAASSLSLSLPSITNESTSLFLDAHQSSGKSENAAETPVGEEDAHYPRGQAPIICFTSGRGAMGKTTLACATAALFAQAHVRCALIDLDLSCGNAARAFGIEHPFDLARLYASPQLLEIIDKSAVYVNDNLALWGPCEKPETAELVNDAIPALISYATNNFDVVVIDTSTTFTDAVCQAVQAADRVMIIHDDMYDALSSLGRTSALVVRLGVARTRICRVQNYANAHAKLDFDFARGEIGLEGASVYGICDGGSDIGELMSLGNMLDICAGNSTFIKSMQTMVTELAHSLRIDLKPDHEHARTASKSRKRTRTFFGKKERCAS